MTLQEIQNHLSHIRETGFIPSIRKGPTGIGRTIEKLLNLDENNVAIPDIGGRIELKATRRASNSMITLFTFNRSVWKIHKKEIIEIYGYRDEQNRQSLYSSVFCNRRNPQNLEIELDRSNNLINLHHNSGVLLATWSLYAIVGKFTSKFERLLMVLADNQTNEVSGKEEFLFDEAYILERPSPEIFLKAFENSQIAIDIRMHLKPTGTVRNHGTCLRIKESNLVNLYADRRRIL